MTKLLTKSLFALAFAGAVAVSSPSVSLAKDGCGKGLERNAAGACVQKSAAQEAAKALIKNPLPGRKINNLFK
jgi:hypothetical protein